MSSTNDNEILQVIVSHKPVLNIDEIISYIHPYCVCGGGQGGWNVPSSFLYQLDPLKKSLTNWEGGCPQATNSQFLVALLAS